MLGVASLGRFRRWRWTGGHLNIPGYHWEAWAAIDAFFLALGSIFVLAVGGWMGGFLGVALFLIAAYIGVSFFLPLRLPRMRDERLVIEMRRRLAQLDAEREAADDRPTP